ncbi:MAG: hypothetical protein PHV45_04605 [Desulfuromonas thiophila]|nr:hypothetical protein [Desulfuromonas thiophila]
MAVAGALLAARKTAISGYVFGIIEENGFLGGYISFFYVTFVKPKNLNDSGKVTQVTAVTPTKRTYLILLKQRVF